jgi:hypothetical protein
MSLKNLSRRGFLQLGVTVPTLRYLGDVPSFQEASESSSTQPATAKCAPVDLSSYFTASPFDFGPRSQAKGWGWPSQDGYIHLPGGNQSFRGVPFLLGPEGTKAKSWLVLSSRNLAWSTREIEIPIRQLGTFICWAQFCDWSENINPQPGEPFIESLGEELAQVTFMLGEGVEHTVTIRRHFEVNTSSLVWGNPTYAALSHRKDEPLKLTDPLSNAMQWGFQQWTVKVNSYQPPILWLSATKNPFPDKIIQSLRIRASSSSPLVICGISVFRGNEPPFRYTPLTLYRITLPEAQLNPLERWEIDTDLGVVGRTYTLEEFDPQKWLPDPRIGLGDSLNTTVKRRFLYAEVTASPDAKLILRDKRNGTEYAFMLSDVGSDHEQFGQSLQPRIEMLEKERVWLHGQVLDASLKQPTPVRLAFRSADGRYIPPYGHRTEVNDGWFQDYGGDLKLMNSSFAYIDGTFQVELPVGDVYVEMTKGFEYEAVRRRLEIKSSQRELKLQISRIADLSSQGWMNADTHVHFLSPSTAILEGQAEGLNLINLLAAQWGDMFSNVSDFPHGSMTSQDRQTMVWLGTENRQHLLGHLGLLGTRGKPVYPMSTAGPGEGYLGDPMWTSLSDWADACREREGLVVAAHFPHPPGELAADIVMGKIDAVELQPLGMNDFFNTHRFHHYYRFLNAGYRLPIVAGTDKMGAFMPLGATRTYAYLKDAEFSFANWAKAVRNGNTFMTSGPLLQFEVEGQTPGSEISLGSGGGTLEVHARAQSYLPVHRLDVVVNGQVAAATEESRGSKALTLRETVRMAGPGWLAARCVSRVAPFTVWSMSVAAHSSPVYVRVGGQDPFSPADAVYLLTLIDGGQTWLDNLATRPSAERFARARKVFTDARTLLHRKLHEHGIPH